MRKISSTTIAIIVYLIIILIFLITGFFMIQTSSRIERAQPCWKEAVFLGKEGVIIQERKNYCGPASMKMFMGEFGIDLSVEKIAELAGVTSRGTSMAELMELARTCGLETEGWKLTWEDFRKVRLPALLFVNGNHYVIASEFIRNDSLIILDPAVGKLKTHKNELMKIWKGETLVISKDQVLKTGGSPG